MLPVGPRVGIRVKRSDSSCVGSAPVGVKLTVNHHTTKNYQHALRSIYFPKETWNVILLRLTVLPPNLFSIDRVVSGARF